MIIGLLIIGEILVLNAIQGCFAISGINSLILSIFINNFIIQLVIFVILGLFLILTVRPYIKQIVYKN
jgi:membrane protein implicated in regulation of membrane protease activity